MPSAPEIELQRGGSRRTVTWLFVIAACAAAALWLFRQRSQTEVSEAPVSEPAQLKPVEPPRPAATPEPTPTPTPTPAPTPAATEAATSDAGLADAGVNRVVIRVRPEGARIYRKGKEVGVSPYTVEVPHGERRAFEVIERGFQVRKVVIDGSKPEVFVGLKPETATPASDGTTENPAKP